MWREWLYATLSQNSDVTDIFGSRIFGASSAEGKKQIKPFILLRTGAENPELEGDDAPATSSQFATVWLHDEPGSYIQIDNGLEVVREALLSPALVGSGIACRWLGDSAEFADESFGTITRNGSYQLIRSK